MLASERVDPDVIGHLVVLCRGHQVKLSVVSPLRGRALPVLRISQVADLPVFDYETWDVSRSTLMLKRVFDVVFSVAGLVVLAPLFPLVAAAIRLDSRGRVIFTQFRAGTGGRPFRMYKLRTMTADAEESLSEIVRLEDLREPMFKLPNDPRVTRVGRLLRRFSFDELPQLVNVLRGQMSIVGPRPEQVELVERYAPEHRFRLEVKPGMTGPMQVFGRGELSFGERLAVELDYVENMSLGRDLRILFQTAPAIIRGTGRVLADPFPVVALDATPRPHRLGHQLPHSRDEAHAREPPRACCERLRVPASVDDLLHRSGDRRHARLRDQHTVDAVADDVAGAPRVECDDRGPARERLDHRDPEVLLADMNEAERLAVEAGQLLAWYPAAQLDVIGEAAPERRLPWPYSDHHKPVGEVAECLGDELGTLVRDQPPHPQKVAARPVPGALLVVELDRRMDDIRPATVEAPDALPDGGRVGDEAIRSPGRGPIPAAEPSGRQSQCGAPEPGRAAAVGLG